ncbi:MAG: ABC-F family ATP-binding cassette domain-containing protein [Gemmatimonadales bacterium]|nr:ABC-F family ATP-binding cassette domain-containing protein [Gemmatimonadales bacterium]
MALLSLTDAYFDYGREKILRGINLALHPGMKCALVGANGSGKTTLLAALSGELDLQGGSRQMMGGVRIQLLRQETSLETQEGDTRDLRDVVADSAFGKERSLEREMEELAHRLTGDDPTGTESNLEEAVQRQGKLQAEFERLDGYTAKARLETALRGVGLMPDTWNRRVETLSGGERRRGALATALLNRADLLLLDEPTNHLDLESCEWLENFLEQFSGAAIIVSHDRQFLDRITGRTLHLDRGRLISYSGNYSFFAEQSRLRYQQDLASWQRQQTRLRQTEEYIRRNIEGQKTRQAQARRKQMAKEERLERPSTEPGLFRFDLRPERQSGGTVLEVEGLGKAYDGRTLLTGFSLHVSRGDRIGIVGPNGCGKSTLLKILAGRIISDAGRVSLGHNVDAGFYDQELSSVSDHNTAISELEAVDPRATLGELRSFLAAFGFDEDLYDRQVGRLSGGERGRLALMRLIKEGHNTLLLDEPTNHLDIRSRESLEASLQNYAGTLIVVSHDRRFLDKVVDRLLVFGEGGRVTAFSGNYKDFVRDREKSHAGASGSSGAKTPSTPKGKSDRGRVGLSKNEQQRRTDWMDEAEKEIQALEEEKEQILVDMGAADLDNDRRLELARRCSEIEDELTTHTANWEKWGLEIEDGQ